MLKKIIQINLVILLSFFTLTISSTTTIISDGNMRSDNLKPFDWKVISGIENLVINKNMSKSAVKKLALGNEIYGNAIEKMKNKDYAQAIEMIKEAIKKNYKRAKISDHDFNYIYINLALCYANTGKEQDKAMAKRYLSFVTSKIEKEKEWLYNMGIANNKIGENNTAKNNFTMAIRLDENYFQSYITLEAIHRNLGNKEDADRVRDRMETAEARLIKKENKNKKNNKDKKSENTNKEISLEGKRPNVKDLKIVTTEDHLQYNKSIEKDRSANMIQDGIDAYEKGVTALKNGDYTTAVTNLKIAEKKLKSGKVKIHGLNFSRGNLAIANLCTDEKSKLGQVKRNLKNISNKLYDERDWTYNMAVVNYEYGFKTLRGEPGSDKWLSKAKSSEFIKNAIRLFKLTIKHDKLYLDSYLNLVYIYEELSDMRNAEKYQKQYEKRRDDLIRSFDREEQIKMGVDNEYVFRIHVGKYGEYEAPADMFDEPYLITVPINERITAYLSGMYFTLDEAIVYQKEMIKKGYLEAYIVAYKDGDKIDF